MNFELMHGLVAVLAAVGGGVVGAIVSQRSTAPVIAQLRDRLERSEQARNGAVERSAQAREQIAQLNRAITEMRRANSRAAGAAPQPPEPETREQRAQRAEAALRAAADEASERRRAGPAHAFADTQTMEHR